MVLNEIDSCIVNKMLIIMHFINSPYNFSIQNCPQNSDRVQFWFQPPKRVL